MIEFFLSKFWAFLCAILLLGVSSACITNISTSVEDASEKAGLMEFVSDIDAFISIEGPCQMRLEIERYIIDESDSLIIRNGSVWLNGPGHNYAEPLPITLRFIDVHGSPVEGNMTLELGKGTVLVLQQDIINGSKRSVAYEENAATSLRTASTNVLQSSSSL